MYLASRNSKKETTEAPSLRAEGRDGGKTEALTSNLRRWDGIADDRHAYARREIAQIEGWTCSADLPIERAPGIEDDLEIYL
jgi:hypothetical protein